MIRRTLFKLAGMTWIPGSIPAQRPDQALQQLSRAGSGPAPASPVVVARLVIVQTTSGGVFVYSPTAAKGNLIASMTAGTTGPFGETVKPGVTSYQEVAGVQGLTTQIFNGLINFLDQLSPDPVTHNSSAGILHQTSAGQSPVTFIDSPSTDAGGLHASLWLIGKPTGAGNGRVLAWNGVDNINFQMMVAGVFQFCTVSGGVATAVNIMRLGPLNEFEFDHALLVGANGSTSLLVRYDQDTTGYPVITDANGLALNNSGCQPASSNKNTILTTTFGNLAVFTIPAGNPEAGAVYEQEFGGYGANATGALVALTLQARFGASPGASTDVVGTPFTANPGNAVGDAFQWSARVRAQCVTSGAAATWRLFVTGIITDTVTNFGVPFAVGTGPTDITQDSTAAINFGLSAKWASTTGTPTITKSGAQPGRRS